MKAQMMGEDGCSCFSGSTVELQYSTVDLISC
jgi:hypothetical protein